MNCYLAIDFGASSGRHMLFWLENGVMRQEEIYRFSNGMVEHNGHLCWEYDGLFAHIIAGMKRCAELGKIPESVGIDTWGVDFVLLDGNNEILGDTVGYRDHRTDGMDAEVYREIAESELYRRTGIQKAIFNTVYQLMAVKKQSPEILNRAEALLTVPDYFNWRLCGVQVSEYTEASTTQLLNPETCDWDDELIERLGYPRRIFKSIVQPGTAIGVLTDEIAREVGYSCRVVLPAAHDTASAVLANPSEDPDTVFISSGTWSLLGVELDKPDCTEQSRVGNFSNEGGFGGKICYLKNIMGLWMIQSVKKELALQGTEMSFAELCDAAEQEEIDSTVACDDDRFLSPESMTEEIRAACRESGQAVPQTPGELAAVVYRSLAKCYGEAVCLLRKSRGRDYRSISILGGGSNAEYLNRLTARETGCTVYAGPGEATAIGNAMAQMLESGEFADVKAAKQCVLKSFDIKVFEK